MAQYAHEGPGEASRPWGGAYEPRAAPQPSIKSSVYLTARQQGGLSALSERTLILVTQLIRVAVDYLLAHPEATIRAVQRGRHPPPG